MKAFIYNIMHSFFNIAMAVFLVVALQVSPTQAGGVESFGAQATHVINDMRAQNGLGKLRVDDKLTRAAQDHAWDMVQNEFFNHTGSNGSSMGKRIRARKYGFCFAAENIAKGQKTLAEVMESWMASKGHRRNILSAKATEFGLVRGQGDIWVMVLARPGC